MSVKFVGKARRLRKKNVVKNVSILQDSGQFGFIALQHFYFLTLLAVFEPLGPDCNSTWDSLTLVHFLCRIHSMNSSTRITYVVFHCYYYC